MKCKEYQYYKEENMNILIKIVNRNDIFDMMKNKLISKA